MAIPYLLKGDIDEPGTYIRKDAGHYARLRVCLVRGHAAAIDTAARRVALRDGGSLPYDRLLVASGSRPSRESIPGIDLPGVQACWTLADARAILARARPGARVVQMGAGFVGCIIMEGLLARGVDLTILVRSGYMVRRMMNPTASGLIRRWCEAKGVKILTRTQPQGLARKNGNLEVNIGDGRALPADIYLSAVGVDPNLEFVAGSGIEMGKGLRVDATLQTSAPGVYAAGDVAESVDGLTGQRQLNAIQPNAVEQGRIAALNMAGRPARFKGSFVFNVLTTLGLAVLVVRAVGGRAGRRVGRSAGRPRYRYLNLQFDGDRLVGANCVGFLGPRWRPARPDRRPAAPRSVEEETPGRSLADHAGVRLRRRAAAYEGHAETVRVARRRAAARVAAQPSPGPRRRAGDHRARHRPSSADSRKPVRDRARGRRVGGTRRTADPRSG